MESRSPFGEIDGGKTTQAKTEPGTARVTVRIIARNTNLGKKWSRLIIQLMIMCGVSADLCFGATRARSRTSSEKSACNKMTTKTTQNDFLPAITSSERQDHVCKMADEISRVADKIKGFRRPEISEIEWMAEICWFAGGYWSEEVMHTLAAERGP